MIFNKEYETMPEKKMKELQLERLKWSINHAYNNNSFFKKKYDEAGFNPAQLKSLEDVKRIPFLTKDDMRNNYPFGLFAVPLDKVVRVHASSGTTGKPTVVGYTKNDIEVFSEVMARGLACCGATEKDIIQVAFGYGLFTGGLGYHYGAERLGAMVVPTSSGNSERQLTLIQDFGTTMIACTPSYILNVADHIERKRPDYNIRATKLRRGVFGAEPWSEGMRKEIESRLGIEAFDLYGLSEIIGPGVSSECSHKPGMHVFEDHFYPEVIDPETGEVLPEGEKGEIVFTTLTKEAFPGIRYRTRDISRLYRESCECGRTYIKMEKVTGRSDDMLIIKGVNLFPSQIESVLMEIEGTEPHYQIIVDRKGALDEIEVMVEVDEKLFSDEVKVLDSLKKRIKEKFKSALSISATINLVEPMTIPRSEGKAVRVIDKRKI
ncbi:MAG: phenylacetate--CoA ligase [Spirochaetota bacterium]